MTHYFIPEHGSVQVLITLCAVAVAVVAAVAVRGLKN
jgi:hypothetical protein